MKQKLFLKFLLLFLLFSSSLWAQDLQLKGKIIAKNGSPLANATITVKGTTKSTVSTNDGSFMINAPQNATLVFSYVGMADQEYVVKNNNAIYITLSDKAGDIDEVVVIGYGSQKKSVVTGAISSVKAKDLENMPIARLEQALQGRTSGLTITASSGQPGAAATVRVRGTTSITNSDPLYVVDGIPIDVGGIDYLNSSDIESIEVLKDAASAAIYGSRAASGVILVTTKKGKSGTMQMGYHGYFGTQAPAHRLKLLNATEYATLRNEAALAANQPVLFANPQALGKGTDWQDVIFNDNAQIQNHELSLSAGNDKSNYYASFGYYDQDGIVATDISNYRRFTARFNSNHKLKSWFTFGNTLGYAHIRSQGIGNTNSEFGGPLSSAINLDPITQAVITDPAIANAPPYSNHTVFGDANGNPYGISQYVAQEMVNPLAYIKGRLGNYGWSDNFVGNVFVELEPIKGLKIKSNIGTKMAFWGSESFTPIAYYNAVTSSNNTSYYRETNRGLIWNWENTISYTRNFRDHNLTFLVGTAAFKENARGTNATYRNLPVSTFEQASMNYNVSTADRIGGGWENPDHKLSSLFARLTYNYKERYLLTAIIRRDGSSRFGSNNKYGYFPSASAGWVVSNESFWKASNTISFLKIRGSYGVTGSENIGDFQYVSTVGGGRNYTFGQDNYVIGYSPNAPSNPDLKWEETSQLNIGFEALLFKKLSVTFDWYNKKTTGMLQPVILPGYVGATGSPTGNVASMTNKGVELELGYHANVGKVTFDVKGNVSYLKNEITNLGTVKYRTGASFQSSDYELTRLAVGQPIGSFYGFQIMNIFQNQAEVDAYRNKTGGLIQPNAKPGDFKYADLNGDGQINADDRTFIGDPTPNWSYGFTVNAAYKGFDLLVFGQGVAGNQVFNGLRRLDIAAANWTTAALNRWTGEGTSNSFPRIVNGDPNKNFSSPSSFYLTDGSYFRIKTVQLGYSLPKSIVSKAGLQRIRIYVGANNLLTFTKYTGFDPEIGGGSYGIDRGVYPQARTYMVGINLGLN